MKGDIRVLRTKEALRQALISLLQEEPFDSIKVTTVAKKANVSRKVFYDHYSTIFDLVADCYVTYCAIGYEAYCCREGVSFVLEDSDKIDFQILARYYTSQLEFYKKNPQFAKISMEAFLSYPYFQKFIDYGISDVEDYLEVYFPLESGSDQSCFDKETISQYLFLGHQFVINKWIKGGMQQPTRVLAQKLIHFGFYVCDYYNSLTEDKWEEITKIIE